MKQLIQTFISLLAFTSFGTFAAEDAAGVGGGGHEVIVRGWRGRDSRYGVHALPALERLPRQVLAVGLHVLAHHPFDDRAVLGFEVAQFLDIVRARYGFGTARHSLEASPDALRVIPLHAHGVATDRRRAFAEAEGAAADRSFAFGIATRAAIVWGVARLWWSVWRGRGSLRRRRVGRVARARRTW